MTPHKYDHILIHRNPFNNKPHTVEYIDPKFIQTRIYFQCESEYFRKKKTIK